MSNLVAKCVLRVELEESAQSSDDASQGAEAMSQESESKQSTRGKRKVHDISVETFPNRLENPRDDWSLLPLSSREQTPMTEKDPIELAGVKGEVDFFSGNPFVEVTKGILHIYKEDYLTSPEDALTLCLLGVPRSMTCHDILTFVAPSQEFIAHIRILSDQSPNQYMCLLTFRNHETAMEFYLSYNGMEFNSLEPDVICKIVWVSRIEWAHDGVPPVGHTELPMCPVCLERMDESVAGVLTILCNHAFHTDCLEKWGDSTCPVCRCVQSPEQQEVSECEKCGKTVPSPDALWICLICGNVGCGRYVGGHAFSHYMDSGHCYALQLGSHRVWDYKGDNFVHRLLQNKGDGKLVPSEGPPSEAECAQEKVDSVQLEFTYLMTSQLDEQRMYFENKLAMMASQFSLETEELRQEVRELTLENKELKSHLNSITREKQCLEKKVQQQNAKLSATLHELNEEKQLGKALRSNQQQWPTKFAKLEEKLAEIQTTKDQEIAELKEQVRDLMFFINAQQAIEKSEDKEEIAQGTVTVGESTQTKGKKGKRRK